MYDLAIIGGGPAAVAAGVYAARKKLKTVFITVSFESQSAVSENVQNWIGTISLPGTALAENLKNHLKAYANEIVSIKEGEKAESIKKENEIFKIKTNKGEYSAKTILLASGSQRRKLEVPGAAQFENKGITYCASCDGPLFADKDITVIGGGNAGFETASQLLAYAKSVTLINRSDFKADPVTVEKVLKHPKMKALKNIETLEIKGDKFVKSIVFKDKTTGKITEMPTEGIFVEIGLVPNTDYVANFVKLDQFKRVPIDPKTQRVLDVKRVWAAGDCTDVLYHQNNIAAGDGVRALEDIYLFLHAKEN